MSPSASDLPGLLEADWEQLVRWNRPLPKRVESCIHHDIERQAAAHPRKTAVATSDRDITYSDLDLIATRVATMLRSRGVGPEVIVPLYFDKSAWMIIAMVAVLKVGGAFVALDPKSPAYRLRTMLDLVDAKVVITAPEYLHVFVDFNVKATLLSDKDLSTLPDHAADGLSYQVQPNNAAYVIFTSGSTGTPKGVVVEHESFYSGMALHAPAQFLDEHSRALQFAAYTHDACLAEILTTLCVGGTVCSPTEDQRSNGLVEFINEKAVTWAVLTPSFIASIDPSEVPSLEVVVLAGERLSQSNIDAWAASVRLLSGYGVSECSVVTTISHPADQSRSPANIGVPAGGVCWIVDPGDLDRLAPIGTVGEILVEGPTVARGYIKDLEATRRAFIDPPSWLRNMMVEKDDRKARLYRTGDLGRQNPDGTLDFISRIDSQVKVAGRRIELGEIEHHISTHPDVRICMVVYPQVGAFANQLVAILELHGWYGDLESPGLFVNPSDTQKIAAYVREKAPTYMVPPFWFAISHFPRLPSAKLDRRKVEAWLERRQMTIDGADSEDQIPVDDEIAWQIRREVESLRNSQVQNGKSSYTCRRNTPLRRLGIDSIKSISLMKVLQRQFGVKISVAYLMENEARPTSIADYIRRATSLGETKHQPPRNDLTAEFTRLKTHLDRKLSTAPPRLRQEPRHSTTVLLTGASGYLGQEILRQLLAAGFSVVALVRASTLEDARRRLVDEAVAKRWWSPVYEGQLQIWLGDMSQSDLGFSPQMLQRLHGHEGAKDCIHAIIHNGARVHWSESANMLWPVNVDATVRLLETALESPLIRSFVYVSGGANIEGSIHEQLTSAPDGYSQTKLLSQGLVHYCSQSISDLDLDMSAVKPGFIIGAPDTGVINPSDYLWRFVATAIDLGICDGDSLDSWIPMSTLPLVAKVIVSRLLGSSSARTCLDVIEDGLQEKDVWEAARKLGHELRPVNHQTWARELQGTLDTHLEEHSLWPLQSVLEQQGHRLGQPQALPRSKSRNAAYLRQAVCQNIKSLGTIFSLHPPDSRRDAESG